MLDLGPGYVPAFITEEVLPSAPVAAGWCPSLSFHAGPRVLAPWRTEDADQRHPPRLRAAMRQACPGIGRSIPQSGAHAFRLERLCLLKRT